METLKTNIKGWYRKEYPTDTWGIESINDIFTFHNLNAALNNNNVQVVFSDSIVRERCFEKLSNLLGCDYDSIYDKWLHKDNTKKYVYISN